ncbi:MAG: flippase-like domain-containing protein [Chloroflexi bacterium]|nr:flippase-like domain-containing protein [Chloroflexota bacterium]
MRGLLAKLKDPKTLAGLILGAVALALLLSFSDIHQVGDAFTHFPPVLLPVIFGLIAGRELVRTVEWRYLLHPLRVKASWRHTTEALIAGDAAQILPAGIFLQNFVLRQTEEADVTRTLAATLVMQFLEAAVGLIVLVVVPVPGWWWLRWAAVIVFTGWLLFLILITRQAVQHWIEQRGSRNRFSGWLAKQGKGLLENLQGLGNPWVIGRAIALTALYMSLTVANLYAITRGYHLPNVNWLAAAVIYCFTLVVIVLNPLPSDWGVSEGLGTAVFVAFGVQVAQGLTIMLLLRFSMIFSSMILTTITAAIFHEDVKEVVEGPPVDLEEDNKHREDVAQPAPSKT